MVTKKSLDEFRLLDFTISQYHNVKWYLSVDPHVQEYYKDSKGEKQTDTNWHTVVAWGKTAEIVEKYVEKGKEVGITGKLKTRTYTTDDGNQRYVTEVVADEILLLGSKNDK